MSLARNGGDIDFKGYIEWQEKRSKENNDNNIEFIKQLVATQAFSTFIEQSCLGARTNPQTKEGFFELNIEFVLETSLKKLKQTQQELIDQAKLNLAQPVKLKFSGIVNKYAELLRSREAEKRSEKEQVSFKKLSH